MNQVIFNEIQALKRQLLPTEKMFLFGSQARGDALEDSDWDLLILLKKSAGFKEDFDMYGYPFIECGMNNNEDVNVHLYTVDEWETYKDRSLLYYNVNKEGIEL